MAASTSSDKSGGMMKELVRLEIWFDGNFVTSVEEAGADELFRHWIDLPALGVFIFNDGSREVIHLENM